MVGSRLGHSLKQAELQEDRGPQPGLGGEGGLEQNSGKGHSQPCSQTPSPCQFTSWFYSELPSTKKHHPDRTRDTGRHEKSIFSFS